LKSFRVRINGIIWFIVASASKGLVFVVDGIAAGFLPPEMNFPLFTTLFLNLLVMLLSDELIAKERIFI
jgi:hypothetical protein